MNEYQDVPDFENTSHRNLTFIDIKSLNHKDVKSPSKIVQLPGAADNKNNPEIFLFKETESRVKKERTESAVRSTEAKKAAALQLKHTADLFRLFVKNGEYVYARPNDIIMMESCDHLVKVYLSVNEKIKKTIRHNTLKDFLLQLPQEQFLRIGRFCAVNIHRLSGGNCNEQTFEFDFRISIKLNHAISQAAFGNIGK